MVTIFHNNRCSKSRETLALLENLTDEFQVVKYLETPPSKEELSEIISKLGIKPEQLLRKSEAIFKEQFKGKELTDEEWIEVMVENPKLIERPIVVRDDKAVLGRPPQNVEQLF